MDHREVAETVAQVMADRYGADAQRVAERQFGGATGDQRAQWACVIAILAADAAGLTYRRR